VSPFCKVLETLSMLTGCRSAAVRERFPQNYYSVNRLIVTSPLGLAATFSAWYLVGAAAFPLFAIALWRTKSRRLNIG